MNKLPHRCLRCD